MGFLDPTIFGDSRLTLEWYKWIVYVVFVVVLAIALWILYDSQSKRKEAMLWRVITVVGIIFIIPSLVLAIDGRFSQNPLALRIPEAVKFLPILGIIGGLAGILALIGYVGWAKPAPEAPPVSIYPPLPETQAYVPPPPPISMAPLPADTRVGASSSYAESVASVGPAKTEILQRPPAQMAWFIVRAGPRAGKEFRLGEVTNIGRDATQNDIAIDDTAISRQHARVRLEEGKFVLYDLASANGTSVNGEKILKHELANSDLITMGETQFTFMQVVNA